MCKRLISATIKKYIEFIRFIFIGSIAATIQYLVYILLLNFKFEYNISYTFGYILSFIFNFFASNFFTFKTNPNIKRGIKFSIAHFINYILQITLLNIFINVNIKSTFAPFLVLSIAIPTNFILVRFALKYNRDK